MKRTIAFLGALGFSSALFAATPVARYDFDGATGLPDKALKGKVSYDEGVRGKALKMADAVLTIPRPAKLSPQEGTVTLWLKPVNWDGSRKEFVFFLQSLNKARNGRLILYKYSGAAGLGTTLWFGNPDGKKSKENTYVCTRKKTDMEQGKWYFLAAAWSRKANILRVYINGKEVASGQCKDTVFFDEFGDFLLNPPPFRPADRSYETLYDMLRFYTEPLTEKELTKIYEEESRPALEIPISAAKPTFLSVPLMKAPPRIDGNFEAAEWASAAKMGGFIELRNPRLQTDPDTQAYVGCDKKKIYFCFVGKIPGSTKLVNRKTGRDSEVYADDAFEIYLRPPEMDKGFYQAIFNYGDAIFDTRNSDKKWNGAWTVRNGIYEGHWICEIAIDLAEFGTAFREDARWKFNFCRDRQQEPDIIFSSVSPAAMPYRAWFADLRTTGEGAFGRLTLDYSRLFERKLALDLEVVNQSEKNKNTTLEVTFLDAAGRETGKKVLKATVPGKKTHTFRFEDPLTGFRAGIVRLDATAEGGERIFSQDIPLVFKDEVAISTETDLEKARLSFEIDLKSHYRLAGTDRVQVSLKSKSGKTLHCRAEGKPAARGSFDLASLPPGDCTLVFRFLDKNGRELLKTEQYYNHIGRPAWLTEKPGANAGVVPPYTPIRRKGSTLSVIGRDHVFGSDLLPDEIVSAGVKLFAAPPVLKGRIDGKNVEFRNFKSRTVKASDDVVELAFTASAGGLDLRGTMRMEFDGFLWYTLETARKDVTLNELFLEMEMPSEVAAFYNGHFFSRENYVGKVKPPLDIRRVPSLWSGCEDVGLTMVTESFQYWSNRDPLKAFRLFSRGGNTVWQVRFVDRDTKLAKRPLKLEFGFEANPVKPLPADFRSWRVHAHKPANICHPSQVKREIRKYSGYNGGFTPEFVSMQAFRDEVKRFRDMGMEMSLYLNPTLTSPDTTEYKIFRRQWRNPYNVYPQCPASSLSDLTIWQVDQLIREGGLKGVYVDSLGAVNCANPLHGCGYIDETGAQKLTWPVRAVRNYMKRLYSLLHAPGTDRRTNFLWAHMSARTCAPINAFVDFQASGEELETVITENQNYLELYDLDAYLCYYLNSSGVVPMLLPNLGRVGSPKARWQSKYNDQIMALVLLHDSMLWVCWCHTDYIRKFYRILDDFGYRDPRLEFHSYRKQKALSSPDDEVYISYYRLDSRVMAVVVNRRNVQRSVRVDIDWKALGLSADSPLKDARTGRELPQGGALTLDIPGYNFALIQIGK
ncbi:MAG: hypothetical protein IJU70_12350 [Lentisphaeria bacterium]|nr:hypothetical protein [Lentisphaeria bacterium]